MNCTRVFKFIFIAQVLHVGIGCAQLVAQTRIVLTPFGGNNAPEIEVANADGSNLHGVLPVAFSPHLVSVDVDPRNQIIYYGGYAADYEIGRVKLDGTGQTTLYSLHTLDPLVFNRSNATPAPYGISVDTVNNKVYWTGGQNNSNGFGADIPTFIQRANLDGTGVETVRQSLWTASSPYSIVVNGASGKMYWTDESDFSIRSANLNGSGMQTLLNRAPSGAQTFPWLLGGLAIDFQHNVMFWAELTPDQNHTNIMTADLNGSGVHSVTTVNHAMFGNWFGMPVVTGMDVDPATSQVYFANSNASFTPQTGLLGAVYRMNYDGTNLQTLISNTARPVGLALLVPEPAGAVLVLLCSCMLCMLRGRGIGRRA
jgi:hypothetical protein